MGNIRATLSFGGLILCQSLLSLPRLSTRLGKNGHSCVSVPVESCFRPHNRLPGSYPLLHFFSIPSTRNRLGVLECSLAETVSPPFWMRNPLDLSNLVVFLPMKPYNPILSYCFVPGGEGSSPSLWHPVKIVGLDTPKV